MWSLAKTVAVALPGSALLSGAFVGSALVGSAVDSVVRDGAVTDSVVTDGALPERAVTGSAFVDSAVTDRASGDRLFVGGIPANQAQNAPYNGDFTFTRIRYGSSRGRFGRGYGWGSSWAHDYPDADRNMQFMLDEFTAMRANTTGSNVLDLEDREIFRNPILYISEPGFWGITDEGAANLREYLLKGGFLISDDFEANQWYNMAEQVARALPEGAWVEIDESHPIFETFFHIDDIYVPHPLVNVTPIYRVIFEDNDPFKRVMVLANHNSDLAEYWEYAARGYFAVDPTNDAFRLGINYLLYGVTH